MRRIYSGFALILFPLLITLGSCTQKSESIEEHKVFSVLYNDNQTTPFRTDWLILQEYEKRANVILDVKLGDDSDYEKAIFQTFDSGKIPDIVLKVWPGTIESYANTGILLPFSDYEEYLPHFRAYIAAYGLQDELDRLRMENGKYYMLPGYRRQIQVQQWAYRKDLFDLHGLTVPRTYEEMFDSLVVLRDIYPGSTPITASWGGAHLLAMMGAGYDIPAGWNGNAHYNEHLNVWEFAPATEQYRELHAFLHRCYNSGILDPEMFDQSNEAYNAKILDGRALIVVTWITSGFDNWNTILRKNGISQGEWFPMPVPESTIGIRAVPGVDAFRKGLIVPARVANESYFLDLLAFLDWAVYSEEGRTLTTWGIEGLTFKQTPEEKRFLPYIRTPKNPDATVDIRKEYGFDLMFNLVENEEHEDYKKPPEIVAFLENSLQAGEIAALAPDLKIPLGSLEAVGMVHARIAPYVAEMSRKFITGEYSINADWNAYITELENRGKKTIEAIWNDAWRRQRQ